MRSMTTLSRRAAVVAVAGALAFGVSACTEGEGSDVDDAVTEDSLLEEPATTELDEEG